MLKRNNYFHMKLRESREEIERLKKELEAKQDKKKEDTDMDNLDTEDMVARFQKRAEAVHKRTMPPIAGAERREFIKQAELDYQDFAIIADAEISLDGGVLTIDLRPTICDAAIRDEVPGPLDYVKSLPTDGANTKAGFSLAHGYLA